MVWETDGSRNTRLSPVLHSWLPPQRERARAGTRVETSISSMVTAPWAARISLIRQRRGLHCGWLASYPSAARPTARIRQVHLFGRVHLTLIFDGRTASTSSCRASAASGGNHQFGGGSAMKRDLPLKLPGIPGRQRDDRSPLETSVNEPANRASFPVASHGSARAPMLCND